MQSRSEEAEEQYEKAIESMDARHNNITRIAGAFMRSAKYDLAIKTYEKGAKLLKDENIFAYNLGDLYRRKGDMAKMVNAYLLSVESKPQMMNSVKNRLIREVTPGVLDTLQDQLIVKIQDNPERIEFQELLLWVFTQKKAYSSALRQARALDLRLGEDGRRVFNLATVAGNDGDYDVAISGFQYILDQKANTPIAMQAKESIMTTKRRKITRNFNYTEADLSSLEEEYESFLAEKGRNANTALNYGKSCRIGGSLFE